MKTNRIEIVDTRITKNEIVISYEISGTKVFLECFEKKSGILKLTYLENIENVPIGIANIPVVCLFCPVVWLFDAELILKELDQNFYESIPDFKQGYKHMYPDLDFAGKVNVQNTINYSYSGNASVVLFSGGVDAFNTLVSHYQEMPLLVTIWGADIAYNNVKGWDITFNKLKDIATLFDLKMSTVRSNFRRILKEKYLNKWLSNVNCRYNWWHDFQHGIGLISHVAPIAYINDVSIIYIASSFTKDAVGSYTCASDPIIDNHVKFASTKVIHDGYDFNRQQKIENISEFSKSENKSIPLRVCYEAKDGSNCCRCEKCYRTILGILAEKSNPRDLGFVKYNSHIRKKMIKDMKFYKIPYGNFRYQYIQNRFHENYSYEECPDDFKWFYLIKIDKDKRGKLLTILWKIKRKIKRILSRIKLINR